MLSERIISYLECLTKIAEGQDYKIESITFYNTYAEIPEKEKKIREKTKEKKETKQKGTEQKI